MDLLSTASSELQFVSAGCQFMDNGIVCGEQDSLAIILEMQKMYEEKMNILEREGGGDYEVLQAKNRLQEMWIRDLIQQSRMLISAIQELEKEATTRVRLLEQKIKKSARTGAEVMNKYKDLDIKFSLNETFQNAIYLQSDVNNLLKMLNRYKSDGIWSADDLKFHVIDSDEIFDFINQQDEKTQPKYEEKLDGLKEEAKEKDLRIKQLELTITNLKSNSTSFKSETEVEELKKAMEEMKSVLMAEISDKHDVILKLQQKIESLEEKCRQSDKNMMSKDDAIGEMRKDITQIKSESKISDKVERKKLQDEIVRYREQKQNLDTMIQSLNEETVENQRNNQQQTTDIQQYRRAYGTVMEEILKEKQCENFSKDSEDEYEKAKRQIVEEIKYNYEQQITELQTERQFYREKCEETMIELEKAEKDKIKRDAKIKELGQAIKECEKYQEKYELALAEIEKVNKEKEDYQNRIKILENNGNKELENHYVAKLEEKMNEINMLKQHIENLEEREEKKSFKMNFINNLNTDRLLKDREISNLKDCIRHLEEGQANAKLSSESLQNMMESYRKSIFQLEEREKSLKNEISQQNVTILNLQEALLSAKHELENLRQSSCKEIYDRKEIINHLYNDLIQTEEICADNNIKSQKCVDLLYNLRDDYLDLEVENFNHLQDVEMLNNLILKYQQSSKINEKSLTELVQRMKAEKQEYENIIGYLKNEMAILSDQLQNLQQLLKIANTSNLDLENQTLAGNLIDAQAVNTVLQEQLKVAETQLAYEMRMNKNYISLVEELQDKLSSEAVKNHRLQQKLKDLQYQLDKSESIVRSLESVVEELESTIVIYEKDRELARKKEIQQENEIDLYQKQLKEMTENLKNLETKYKTLQDEMEVKIQTMMQKEGQIKHENDEREQTRTDLCQQLEYAREELLSFKDDMNKTLSNLNSLRAENEKLKCQLNTVRTERNALEQQLISSTDQVEQCTLALQAMQTDKEVIEEKYAKLKTELEGLQSAFDTLSKQYMNKEESLISLEIELVDTKSSHTQLCNESKKVVDNVRSWLEEQKEINGKLERTIKDKDNTINELKGEIRNLRNCLTLPSKLCSNINQRKSYCPSQGSTLNPLSPIPWSLGSQGSESSYSTNEDQGEEETLVTSDVETTENWLFRVESMTEQLQRSNNYWKTRVNDNDFVVTRDQ